MEVILLERHNKLGDIGSIVKVKSGYARNYLLPNKKAIRANDDNKKAFELKREEIQKEFNVKRTAAETLKTAINLKTIILAKQAGKDDRLYGSVNSHDIVTAIKDQLSQELPRSSIKLLTQIKSLGSYNIPVNVFSDVHATVEVLIARSQEEAEQELNKRVTASATKSDLEAVDKAETTSKPKIKVKTVKDESDTTVLEDEEEAEAKPIKVKAKAKSAAKKAAIKPKK